MIRTVVALGSLATATASTSGCYLNTTVRGVGTVPDSCAAQHQKNGLLCYPDCQSGYTGDGPVCWQNCPSGYTDSGALCSPHQAWGDNSGCPTSDKCGLTFHKGCVKCPPGLSASGCVCSGGSVFAKKSYGRTAGTPLQCRKGLDDDAALCYPPCLPGFNGVGPVCWQQCPSSTFQCGAICTSDSKACSDEVKNLADALITLAVDIAECGAAASRPRPIPRAAYVARAPPTNHTATNHTGLTGCNVNDMEAQVKDIIAELALPICPAS